AMDTLSIFSLGMSNTSASLYVGFSVFFLMEVFLFFSLRPSQIREAFTYGSEGETRREREKDEKGEEKTRKMGGLGKDCEKGNTPGRKKEERENPQRLNRQDSLHITQTQ
uniref:Uncharacterized protein n=1 Tax=Monopterus albus TaxID=43700 RepID=A0A3Q3IVK1_MONAL